MVARIPIFDTAQRPDSDRVGPIEDRPARNPTRPPRVPVFDDHMHLDPAGRGIEAVKEFHRAGGTHFMLVHKPYREHERPNASLDDFSADYETTFALAAKVREEVPDVQCWIALAPHPAEFTELLKIGWSIEAADKVYREALDLAASHVRAGRAVAMGEVGRPHWRPIEPAVLDAANGSMTHAFELAKDAGCAVQIHAETATPESFLELASFLGKAGLPAERAVKHYSTPIVDVAVNRGLWPSVLIGKGSAEEALRGGTRFMMETDYMDDPKYPGAVLGPKTVPRRTRDLLASGAMTEDQAWTIHAANPSKVYGIDVAL